jgi:thioredoxin reductase
VDRIRRCSSGGQAVKIPYGITPKNLSRALCFLTIQEYGTRPKPNFQMLQATALKISADTTYDVIIIGGSYAGLSAGLTLGRSLRKVLIIDSGKPCNLSTPRSHNFLTHDGEQPRDILKQAKKQLKAYSSLRILSALAVAAESKGNGFLVSTEAGEKFNAKKIVFATGITDLLPTIPGFSECWGISVLHCPYCHGYEVRDAKTGIFVDADNRVDFAFLISNWTKDLTIFTNGNPSFTPDQLMKLEKRGISVVDTKVRKLSHSKGQLQKIVFDNGEEFSIAALYVRPAFSQHCALPEQLGCELTAEGYINTNTSQETTVHGIFACGDNAGRMRTVANAVSSGTTTGMMVNKQLVEDLT